MSDDSTKSELSPGEITVSPLHRAIAEIDRRLSLPAGHPETLQAFFAGRKRLIVPSTMTKADVEELERLAYGGLEPNEDELERESAERQARLAPFKR